MPELPRLSFRCVQPGRVALTPIASAVAGAPDAPALLSKGALFELLLAMQPDALADLVQETVRGLGALSCHPPTVVGNEIQVHLEDGFFLNAEEACAATCSALGIPFQRGPSDPRIPKDPFLIELGNSRLRFLIPKHRTPSLLELARTGKLEQADPVRAGEVSLHQSGGQMAIRGRGLMVHARDFGPRFIERLESGDDTQQILVTGAGTSRLARDLFFGCERRHDSVDMARLDRLTGRPNREKPRIVAVDMADPPGDTAHPNFRAETGLYRDLSARRLLGGGPLFSDVIDMVGCFTYSPTLAEDLQKSLDMIPVGGMMWIGSTDSVVIYQDDRSMLLPEWLSTIPGLEVDYRPGPPTNGSYFFFSVKKVEADVAVAPLELVYRSDHYPRAVSTIQIFSADRPPLT